MADKSFRVLLDLTELHIECLKYVWMSVSPQELKTITDFKASIIRKINLDNVVIKLFVRNGLLLDDETVMVLREDDTVKVCYVDDQPGCSHTDFKVSKKSSRKRNHTEDLWDSSTNTKKSKRSETLTQEKEAFQSVETCSRKQKKQNVVKCSAPSLENLRNPPSINEVDNCSDNFHNNDRETTSKKNETDFNSLRKSDLFISYCNQDIIEEKNNEEFKTDKKADTDSYLNLNSANDSSSANIITTEYSLKESDINSETIKSSAGLNNNCPKKKRKRRKKRTQGLESVVDVINSTEINKEFKSFTNESENSIQRKHIIYTSSPSKKEEIQLQCGNKNEVEKDVVTDTFTLEDVSNLSVKPHNYPKVSTPIQSDFYKNPKGCSLLMQHTGLNFNQNETVGFKEERNRKYSQRNYADKQRVSYDNSENTEISTELDYTNLPALNSRPDIGTHIAYKILELDEHYSPVISDYRDGIVKSINLDNEEMEIELLKHEIRPGRTGKFENLTEDEVPLPEIKTCDIVRWSTLVDPKIFPM